MSNIPARASRTQSYPQPTTDVDDVPDSFYDTRLPTSTRRYVDTRGNQVIQRGNQRIIIHQEPPRKKFPWLSLIGIGRFIALLLVWGFNALSGWWAAHQLDATYGFPRTYQVDAVVYQGDSAEHPSHYIFLNLNGTMQIIELPHGDSAHARIYKGPTLVTDNAELIPVTGEIKVVNGKEEMLVHIGDQEIIYVNDGSQFKPQQ